MLEIIAIAPAGGPSFVCVTKDGLYMLEQKNNSWQMVPMRVTLRARHPEDRSQVGASRSLSSASDEARLKLEEVSVLTGMGRSKIYLEVREGRFPQPERRGTRHSRWRSGDVMEWLRRGGA